MSVFDPPTTFHFHSMHSMHRRQYSPRQTHDAHATHPLNVISHTNSRTSKVSACCYIQQGLLLTYYRCHFQHCCFKNKQCALSSKLELECVVYLQFWSTVTLRALSHTLPTESSHNTKINIYICILITHSGSIRFLVLQPKIICFKQMKLLADLIKQNSTQSLCLKQEEIIETYQRLLKNKQSLFGNVDRNKKKSSIISTRFVNMLMHKFHHSI